MSNTIRIMENGKVIKPENISGLKIEWLGDNGKIIIKTPFNFSNTTIQIGNDSVVEISENCTIKNLFCRLASENSIIKIGRHFIMESGQFILAKGQKNQSLIIGDDCLFSSNIFIQTYDGHAITDMSGHILNNNGGHVFIGNHVWLGHGVSVLKKASIADNTIVAESTVVSKAFSRSNCILGGVPAKIIKIDVNWNIKSPEFYEKEKC